MNFVTFCFSLKPVNHIPHLAYRTTIDFKNSIPFYLVVAYFQVTGKSVKNTSHLQRFHCLSVRCDTAYPTF